MARCKLRLPLSQRAAQALALDQPRLRRALCSALLRGEGAQLIRRSAPECPPLRLQRPQLLHILQRERRVARRRRPATALGAALRWPVAEAVASRRSICCSSFSQRSRSRLWLTAGVAIQCEFGHPPAPRDIWLAGARPEHRVLGKPSKRRPRLPRRSRATDRILRFRRFGGRRTGTIDVCAGPARKACCPLAREGRDHFRKVGPIQGLDGQAAVENAVYQTWDWWNRWDFPAQEQLLQGCAVDICPNFGARDHFQQ